MAKPNSWRSASARLLAVLGFLVMMPLAAMPGVTSRLDVLLGRGNLADGARGDARPLGGAEERSAVGPGRTRPAPPAGDPPGGGDRFHAIQERLRRLGAEYMCLERIERPVSGYRFRCRIPLVGHGSYRRPFEASDCDALTAMERVLADVEAWRAARGGI